MPELPEVETIKNTVAKTLLHARINKVTVRQRKFRQIVPEDFEQRVSGATVIALRRIAKYMLVDLDNGQTIIWHFGMSGKIKINRAFRKIWTSTTTLFLKRRTALSFIMTCGVLD